MMRGRRLCLTAVLWSLASGCANGPIAFSADEARLANTLAGVWTIRLSLSTAPFGARAIEKKSDIDGQIALLRNSSIARRYAHLTAVTNYGSYNIDFSPFGFDSPETGKPTSVLAGPFNTDSITILLSPNRDDMEIRMTGKLAADSVEGTWSVAFSRAGVGGGRFVMHKVR